MRFMKPRIVLWLAVIGLPACAVNFPQVQHLMHSLNAKPAAIDQYRWQLSAGFFKTEVFAVDVPSGLVFANKQDDAVFFDGEKIARVVKIALDKNRYEIFDIEENEALVRQFWRNGGLVAKHQCSTWQVDGNTKSQQCHSLSDDGRDYENTQKTDPKGQLILVDQVVNADGLRVVLSKVN